MRVVGYIREATAGAEPAFSQQERIRRWANENGHRLIALCQDVRTPGHTVGREGLQSIIGIISAGQVDGVVVPRLSSFAEDKITQEVVMSALRANGITLLSTDRDDVEQLADQPEDGLRSLIRHVLDKQARFESILKLPTHDEDQVATDPSAPDVVIELIPSEATAKTSQAR